MTNAWGSFRWNAIADKQLKELWDQGHTAAAIGKVFGVSKNSIIGRIHRLDIHRSHHGPAPKKCLTIKRPTQPPVLPAPKPGPFSLTIQQLQRQHCRWPSTGDTPPWTFCGEPQEEGSAYCAAHKKRAHHKGPLDHGMGKQTKKLYVFGHSRLLEKDG